MEVIHAPHHVKLDHISLHATHTCTDTSTSDQGLGNALTVVCLPTTGHSIRDILYGH